MPERGDILLYSGTTPLSWAIREVTGSKWSHAGWYLGTGDVLHSDAGGVEVVPLSSFRVSRRAFVRLPVSVEGALLEALSQIGERYDWKLVGGIFFRWTFGLWEKDENGPLSDRRNAWICSELVAKPLFHATGHEFIPGKALDTIVPGDIGKAVELGRASWVS